MFISAFNAYVKKEQGLKIKPVTVPPVIGLLLIFCVSAFITGCSQNSRPEANSDKIGNTLLPPQRTILSGLPDSDKAGITLLENAPKPSIVKVSSVYPDNMQQPQPVPDKKKALQLSQQTHSFIDNITDRPIAVMRREKGSLQLTRLMTGSGSIRFIVVIKIKGAIFGSEQMGVE